jgi:hypothetical protein
MRCIRCLAYRVYRFVGRYLGTGPIYRTNDRLYVFRKRLRGQAPCAGPGIYYCKSEFSLRIRKSDSKFDGGVRVSVIRSHLVTKPTPVDCIQALLDCRNFLDSYRTHLAFPHPSHPSHPVIPLQFPVVSQTHEQPRSVRAVRLILCARRL